MENLELEKVIDRLGSKYEAVVRMSVIARKISDGEMYEGGDLKKKVTGQAVEEYLKNHAVIEKAK